MAEDIPVRKPDVNTSSDFWTTNGTPKATATVLCQTTATIITNESTQWGNLEKN